MEAFKIYLRSNPEEAAQYCLHKQAIVAEEIHTLLTYSKAKASYVADLLERAQAWRVKVGTCENELS